MALNLPTAPSCPVCQKPQGRGHAPGIGHWPMGPVRHGDGNWRDLSQGGLPTPSSAAQAAAAGTVDPVAALLGVLAPLDVQRWEKLVLAQTKYAQIAYRKHTFGMLVGTAAIKVAWSPLRIASILLANDNTIYLGNDDNVITTKGTANSGFPIAQGAAVSFGPEEGNSETWLIAAVTSVDVRCIELIPQ